MTRYVTLAAVTGTNKLVPSHPFNPLKLILRSVVHLIIKMSSYQYYKDKTVSWPSYLYNGNPHTWEDRLYIETGPRCQLMKSPCARSSNDMMTARHGNVFRIAGPIDSCSLCYYPGQAVEQTVWLLVVWKAVTPMWRHFDELQFEISGERLVPVMMTSSNGNISPVTVPLCAEFTGHRWIPLTKASNAELWRFLWSVPEQTVE